MKQLLLVLLSVSVLMAQEPKQTAFIVSDSLVRPTNITTFSINDMVNDSTTAVNKILRFANAGKLTKGSGGSGLIVSASLEVDTAVTTNGNFRLLLFSDSVATVADNAAWVPTHANNALNIGSIDFSLDMNQSAGAGAAMAYVSGLSIPYVASGRKANGYIYGVLLAKAAYVPKFNGKFRVKLGVIRD